MLDELYIKSRNFIDANFQTYERYLIKSCDFSPRLLIITGARGIGKTTTIAQYIKKQGKKSIFLSLDDIEIISNLTLTQLAREFERDGGELLCLDEIHKYENWASELKTIYDAMPSLKIIATGSAALQIHKASHDLSRRAILPKMAGMSFREFLGLHYGYEFAKFALDEILQDHVKIAANIINIIEKDGLKIDPLFKDYLKFGYYPYYLGISNLNSFMQTLRQNIDVSIESDLLAIYPNLNGASMRRLKILLSVIMKSVPFVPNMANLKKLTTIKDDRTLKEYLAKLDDTGLIKLLMKNGLSFKSLDKPEKIYLENTNLMHITQPNIGNLRETFFYNQLSNQALVNQRGDIYSSSIGNFIVDDKFIFEIGGKAKGFNQIKDASNAFIATDDLDIGINNKIPLWMFGFLY
ncbi:MAG: AAA family ATPase [Campylobacter sp.]|nr:AAA family ATPase [Campylobacter sp.]